MSEKDDILGQKARQRDPSFDHDRQIHPAPTLDTPNTAVRLYKCPNCDGEFNTWDSTVKNRREGMTDVCPFCGLERHEYEGGES